MSDGATMTLLGGGVVALVALLVLFLRAQDRGPPRRPYSPPSRNSFDAPSSLPDLDD
jgi:hypothetical protein